MNKTLNLIYFTGLFITFCLIASCTQSVSEDITPSVTDSYSNVWKFHAGEGDSSWTSVDYDDLEWAEVTTGKTLKEQGVKLENGFGWYRKTITISDNLLADINRKEAAVLHLGRISAVDEVYFNGTLIGKTSDFPPNYKGHDHSERRYFIPREAINPTGDNLIAVKFHEGWAPDGGFFAGAALSLSSAGTDDKLTVTVAVAACNYIFIAPEAMKIDVNIENKNHWAVTGNLTVTLETDDYQWIKTDSEMIEIAGKKTYSGTFGLDNPVPGFYRYTVQFKRNSTVIYEKKFIIGYEPEKICSPVDAKEDLREFWDNSLKELAKVKPDYKLMLVPEYSQLDYEIYLVEMRSLGNELIRGYYAKPKREGKHPVIVEYMGYGSGPYPPTQWWDGFARFILSIRGQALNEPENRFGKWMIYGLESKEDYYYRGAFMDVIRALDFVSSRPEIDTERIAVAGGSQGGALSFVAAALDKRVKAAAPTIPFLSDFRDYFRLNQWMRDDFGSYIHGKMHVKNMTSEESQQYLEAQWEALFDLLTYFDIKNLAQWIECPLIMGIGMQDDVCPPHINFAAYNQVKSEKRWIACPDCGHTTNKEYYDEATKFIREKLRVE